MSERIRLDRYLAECGCGSRKMATELVKSGRVSVNDKVITNPGDKISTDDLVKLDSDPIEYEKYVYYILNKPQGCVSATKDNLSDTVIQLLKNVNTKGLFPVGRLDKDTEGLLLITNDGALCHELLSPRKHVAKTYFIKADKQLNDEMLQLIETGIDIGDDKPCLPAKIEYLGMNDNLYEYNLTITEGRFHQVKRMFMACSSNVVYLKRISMGGLILDSKLLPGQYRKLSADELLLLR